MDETYNTALGAVLKDDALADLLIEAGYETPEQVFAAGLEKLQAINGVGPGLSNKAMNMCGPTGEKPEVYIFRSTYDRSITLKGSGNVLVRRPDNTSILVPNPDKTVLKIPFKSLTFVLNKAEAELRGSSIEEIKTLLCKFPGHGKEFCLTQGPGVEQNDATRRFEKLIAKAGRLTTFPQVKEGTL